MNSSVDFIDFAKGVVVDYFNKHQDVIDDNSPLLSKPDIYVVWYARTLQNHKALLSTKVSDGMYYEVTYNGDKKEAYLDVYKKFQNEVISL